MADEELVGMLKKAQALIKEQESMLKQLTAPPFRCVYVLEVDDKNNLVTLAMGNSVAEVVKPLKFTIKAGDMVRLNNEASAIVAKVDKEYVHGGVSIAERVYQNHVEVSIGGEKKALPKGGLKIEEGDNLLIVNDILVKRNLGKPTMAMPEKINVSWDTIGGLVEQKRQIRDIIETPFEHKALFKHHKKKHAKGILLYGPPGNGKTLIGKAAATALAKINGADASTGFIYVKGPELLDPYVGVTEARIRGLFKAAKEHHSKNGYPAIIFIDEADSMLGRRDGGRHYEISSVATFLAETDGFDNSGAMLFLTTNRPDSLDPAVLREGRIDRKIRIPQPDQDSTRSIFEVHIKSKRLEEGICPEKLAKQFAKFLFLKDKVSEIVSGAFITEVVESSASVAMNRDIQNRTMTGISVSDVETATEFCYQQSMELLTA